MYKIIKNDRTIAFVDNPVFIRQLANGNYSPTDKLTATGIVVNDTIYAFNGNILDNKEDVSIIEINNGEKFYELENTQNETDAIIVDQEYRITLLELGVSE
jgi:hypothetical protein